MDTISIVICFAFTLLTFGIHLLTRKLGYRWNKQTQSKVEYNFNVWHTPDECVFSKN